MQIFNDFKDKNFTILGISLDADDDKKLWLKAIKDDGLNWIQVSDLRKWENRVAKLYSINRPERDYHCKGIKSRRSAQKTGRNTVQMIKAIAIDDEPVALGVIKSHAEKIPFLNLEGIFLSATDAFNYLKINTIALVFLDISMPGLSGLEFAEMVKHKAQIVFTTAYPEYALKGFELAATDYLLKPINFSRFLKACQLAERRSTENITVASPDSLLVKDGHNWVPVKLDDLLYIRGEDNYASLFMKDKRILTRMTLMELQNRLPANQFLRIHKSYIISVSKIEKIEKYQLTIAEAKIPLSMLTADSLLQILR